MNNAISVFLARDAFDAETLHFGSGGDILLDAGGEWLGHEGSDCGGHQSYGQPIEPGSGAPLTGNKGSCPCRNTGHCQVSAAARVNGKVGLPLLQASEALAGRTCYHLCGNRPVDIESRMRATARHPRIGMTRSQDVDGGMLQCVILADAL